MHLIVEIVKNNFYLYYLLSIVLFEFPGKLLGKYWDLFQTKRKYKKTFGKKICLNPPKTLNEKIQWLKLYDHRDLHTIVADKYQARNYWKQYGEDGLIPLLYQTYDWKDINEDTIPDEPCIIKGNSGNACNIIIRDKNEINISDIRRKCRIWTCSNFYYKTQEWQYKNIRPCIIIEKLLLDKNGKIPNDYKFHYMNGKLQFVYCAIDREGENYRIIYDKDWNRLDFEWVAPKDHRNNIGKDISKPLNFERMNIIGEKIARTFKYVRVDFYEVDGKMYYGEITLHHGSGFDTFVPETYDEYYGRILSIED